MRNNKSAALICFLLLLSFPMLFISSSAVHCYAQQADSIPQIPCLYRGSVSLNGLTATAGVAVTASINNVVVASTSTDSQGRYGDTASFLVTGDSGDTVVFYINGIQADQTDTLQPGTLKLLNLTATISNCFDIQLSAGWNLVSFPLNIDNEPLEFLLSPISSQLTAVWQYYGNQWLFYLPGYGNSPLRTINSCHAYWICVQNPVTLHVCGNIPTGSTCISQCLYPFRGWNMIGFRYSTPLQAKNYLAGINYSVALRYVNNAWQIIQPDDYLVPGQGIWIYANAPTPPPELSIGNEAPNFTLSCADGSTVTLSELRGKKVIINFWHINCSPSVGEMPSVQQYHTDNPDQALLVIHGTALGAVGDIQVGNFLQDHEYTFTVPLDGSGQVSALYNITSVPRTFFLDSSGVIRKIKDGSFSGINEISTMLASY